MRVLCYMPILYGKDYLKEAIQSVEPFVEKIIIFYTSKPSYGFSTEVTCPDKEIELRTIAEKASNKVQWISGYWGNEGSHRSAVYAYSLGYDIIVTLDADEVFEQQDIPKALVHVMNSKERYFGVNGYINFWRSFSFEVKDFFRPIRFINLNNSEGEGQVEQKIYHFSCAQRDEIMKFKYLVHGHKDELKQDWLEKFYFAWTEENMIKNLHPTSDGIWGDAIPFDKNTLPEALKNHPNFNKKIIS